MKLIIHSDDFGESKGITDTILKCHDDGVLNSTSVLTNGYAFDYAIDKYKKRSNLRLSIHLNLVTGKPHTDVPLLTKNGRFYHSFQSLWLDYLIGGHRKELRRQVKQEYIAQITKVFEATGDDSVSLDSHYHYHMIPFISRILYEIIEEFNINYVRVPYERYVKSIIGINYVKQKLLNHLSKKMLKKLKVPHNDIFIGVMYTGFMTEEVVVNALKQINSNSVVEILFHPNVPNEDELPLFQEGIERNYYSNEWRKKERDVLLSPTLKNFIETQNAKG